MQFLMPRSSLPLVIPEQNRLFHMVHNTCFLIRILDAPVGVGELKYYLSMVVNESWTSGLEEKWSNPCILSVYYASLLCP
jgi:hypothetical protein